MTVTRVNVADSAVKQALDHAEFVERVPELQREAARDGGYTASGGNWLKLPHHPLVIAYVSECKRAPRPAITDLKEARRLLRAARINYEKLCCWRVTRDIEWRDGDRWLALTAVIEARADAMHWRNVVNGLEHIKRAKEANHRAVVHHRLQSLGLAP